jgi:hypothetical protein
MLDDDSDNILPDSLFYIYFVASVSADAPDADECAQRAVRDFKEPFEGAKERLVTSLSAMVNAYRAAEMLRAVDSTVGRILGKRP